MNREEYTEIDNYNLSEMLFNRDEKLIEMIKGLREERDYIFNKLTCEKGYLQEKLNKNEDRIDKAIEHLHKRYEQNNSALTNKEATIISKHELLKLENINNKILEDILRGEDNE